MIEVVTNILLVLVLQARANELVAHHAVDGLGVIVDKMFGTRRFNNARLSSSLLARPSQPGRLLPRFGETLHARSSQFAAGFRPSIPKSCLRAPCSQILYSVAADNFSSPTPCPPPAATSNSVQDLPTIVPFYKIDADRCIEFAIRRNYEAVAPSIFAAARLSSIFIYNFEDQNAFASMFVDVKKGDCASQGFTEADGTKTVWLLVLGEVAMTYFKNPSGKDYTWRRGPYIWSPLRAAAMVTIDVLNTSCVTLIGLMLGSSIVIIFATRRFRRGLRLRPSR